MGALPGSLQLRRTDSQCAAQVCLVSSTEFNIMLGTAMALPPCLTAPAGASHMHSACCILTHVPMPACLTDTRALHAKQAVCRLSGQVRQGQHQQVCLDELAVREADAAYGGAALQPLCHLGGEACLQALGGPELLHLNSALQREPLSCSNLVPTWGASAAQSVTGLTMVMTYHMHCTFCRHALSTCVLVMHSYVCELGKTVADQHRHMCITGRLSEAQRNKPHVTGEVSIYGVRAQHPEALHSQGKFWMQVLPG